MVHFDRFDGPPIEFWENALEFPTERTLQDAKSSTFVENWIQRLNARQVAMLRHLLGLSSDVPVRERKLELREHRDALVSFIVVHKFAGRKSRDATAVIAEEVLDKATIDIAKDTAGTYDMTALMFAILAQSWRDLEKIFHLDKLHRVGFARMCLAKTPRRPKRKFKDFVESDELAVCRT